MHKAIIATAMGLVLITATPLQAQDFEAQHEAFIDRLVELFEMDFEHDREAILAGALQVAADAEVWRQQLADDRAKELAAIETIGVAYSTAADHLPHDWYSEEAGPEHIDYRLIALEHLRTAVNEAPEGARPYLDYRSVATRLAQIARYHELPQAIDWSAEWLASERAIFSVRRADDRYAMAAMAEALYTHGWLVSDAALLAEADELYASFGEGGPPYGLQQQHAAVHAGVAPYPGPGEMFFSYDPQD